MEIRSINNYQNNSNPHFGHTFKVSICVKKPDGSGYDFISPVSNRKLYKQLNSKVVGWLNESYITNLREMIKQTRKKNKVQSSSDRWFQALLSRCLYNIDSDYRKFGMVRSVYNRSKLGYIVTGMDVPIIENMKGATQIGIAKSDALLYGGTTHNSYIDEIVETFRNNSMEYVRDKFNLLRSKNGKEMMLKLNFKAPTVNSKGKTVYDLEDFEMYEIQKSIPLSKEEQEIASRKKEAFYYEMLKTIGHQISKIPGAKADNIEIEKLSIPAFMRPMKRRRPLKHDPNQLEIPFEEFKTEPKTKKQKTKK